jgi:hypothetical protein
MTTVTAVGTPLPAALQSRNRRSSSPRRTATVSSRRLDAEEKAIIKKVRRFRETEVQPIINKYWSDDAFPFELLLPSRKCSSAVWPPKNRRPVRELTVEEERVVNGALCPEAQIKKPTPIMLIG